MAEENNIIAANVILLVFEHKCESIWQKWIQIPCLSNVLYVNILLLLEYFPERLHMERENKIFKVHNRYMKEYNIFLRVTFKLPEKV